MFNRRVPGRVFVALLGVGMLVAMSMQARAQQPAIGKTPQTDLINSLIAKVWADNDIKPSRRATDNEYIRRVFLDLIGRIPTSEEVRDFEADRRPGKRNELVHRLLYEKKYQPKVNGKEVILERKGKEKTVLEFNYVEEYSDHWANVWTNWLLTRTAPAFFREKMHDWLEEEFKANTPHDQIVQKLITATGSTEKNGATTFVIQHLGEMTPVAKDQNRAMVNTSDGAYDAIPITSRTTRLFLGLQTQCTQCHDHPFNPDWKQDNFWGVNGFYRQVNRNPPVAMVNNQMPTFIVELMDEKSLNRTATVFFERRSGLLQEAPANFLRDVNMDPMQALKIKKNIPIGTKKTRRELLAEYVLAHDNFGPAYVNRIWGHLFGRGLNEAPAVDDFGEHNKIVHPDLLSQLSKNFMDYKCDPKQLLEWICTSESYNLTYIAVKKVNDSQEAEAFFSRMPMKSMSPEQLYDSLMTALRGELDPNKATRAEARTRWMNKLVRNFGDDEGNEMTFNGTVIQALLMMNGAELQGELTRPDAKNAVTMAMKRGGNKEELVIDELFMTALGRHVSQNPGPFDPKTKRPMPSELSLIKKELDIAKAKATGDPNVFYSQFYQDVLWALLNTNEFILNH